MKEEQKTKMIMDALNKQPLETIGTVALLKISELAISTNSAETTLKTEATIDGERYELQMVVTYKKLTI